MKEQLAQAYKNLFVSYQHFERESGWSIDQILKIEFKTVEFTPLLGSSYLPLPQISKKKAVLNIQNDDKKMFSLVGFSLPSFY